MIGYIYLLYSVQPIKMEFENEITDLLRRTYAAEKKEGKLKPHATH